MLAAQISTKRIAWATDIHLDHLLPEQVLTFCQHVAYVAPDALLLGGDLSVASTLEAHLRELSARVHCPIYFVLGNHDYYYGSMHDVRFRMRSLNNITPDLNWLPECGVVPLSEQTGLLGIGGWADARLGNFAGSTVRLNDYLYIEDLAALDSEELFHRLREEGVKTANFLREILPEALACYEHVIVLMHVPPVAEACCHDGERGDENWLPHYTCGAAGYVLKEMAESFPSRDIVVLCGHTHSSAVVDVLPNLQVRVGTAEYGNPRIQEIFSVR